MSQAELVGFLEFLARARLGLPEERGAAVDLLYELGAEFLG